MIIKCYTEAFFKSCIRSPIFINICLKTLFLHKSMWHFLGTVFIPLFPNHSKTDFEEFSDRLITSSGVFLSIKCYCLHSLQSLCHYEKEIYHKRNILNKSGPSIDPLVLVNQLRYPNMSFVNHFNHLHTLS